MAARLTAYLVAFIVGTTFIAGLIVGAQRDDDGPVDLIVLNGTRLHRRRQRHDGRSRGRAGQQDSARRHRPRDPAPAPAADGRRRRARAARCCLASTTRTRTSSSGGLSLTQIDLLDARTLPAIEDADRELGRGAIPIARGSPAAAGHYEPFPGGLPTRQMLDALVPDRPAFLSSLRRPHRLGELRGA